MALTPLCIAVAALVALGGVAHQWTSTPDLPWWWLGVAAALLGLGYEWWRVHVCGIAVAVEATRLRLGRQEKLTLVFANAEPRPLTLEFSPGLPAPVEASAEAVRVALPARGEHRRYVAVRAVALGRQSWVKLPMRVRGPLGLAWWSKPCALGVDLLTVPDFLGRGAIRAGNVPVGGGRQTLAGAGRELDHLRDYRPGDPRRMIDWKATARSPAPVTRVMREETRLAVMLVVDAGRASRTRVDGMSQLGHYVNTCARFAEHAAANGDEVGLVAVADQPLAVLAPARGAAAVGRIRTVLTGLVAQAAETDLVGAALAVRQVVRRRCLVVLLTDLYGQAGSGRLMQSVRLWVPKHLPMVAGLIAEEVDALANAPAEDWLDPYLALAATDYRRNLHAAASGLRRLGAYPLITRAAGLEAGVLARYHLLKEQRRV